MEQMDNPKFDMLVQKLNGFRGEKVFNNKRFDLLKWGQFCVRAFGEELSMGSIKRRGISEELIISESLFFS